MVIGKKITRRKPGTGPSTTYFNGETHQAIIDFNSASSDEEKHKIYVERISPAFVTLVENLINVYNFQIQHDSKVDLRNECVEFLYMVIPKFKAEKGSKAFSYFNVVAKHWLTIKSKQSAKATQTFSSIDDRESFSARDYEIIENYHVLPAPDEVVTQDEQSVYLEKLLSEIKARAKTENEIACINAIDLLFDKVEDLEFTNKRGVMVYIRELTNLSPKQLSIVLSSLKKHYKAAKGSVEQQ